MRMKKLFALTLAVMMMVLSFAGCGKKDNYISFDALYSKLTTEIDFSASNMQKQGEAAEDKSSRYNKHKDELKGIVS